jgi:hypothetical protein
MEWYSVRGQVQIDGNKLTVLHQLHERCTLLFKLLLLSNNYENIDISKIFDWLMQNYDMADENDYLK